MFNMPVNSDPATEHMNICIKCSTNEEILAALVSLALHVMSTKSNARSVAKQQMHIHSLITKNHAVIIDGSTHSPLHIEPLNKAITDANKENTDEPLKLNDIKDIFKHITKCSECRDSKNNNISEINSLVRGYMLSKRDLDNSTIRLRRLINANH